MRTLTRAIAAVIGVALSTVLLPSSVASAATSSDCDKSRSTRLYTSGANDEDRLWVDNQSPTRVVVCFRMGSVFLGGLTIVADTASTGTLPNVVVGDDPTICPNE